MNPSYEHDSFFRPVASLPPSNINDYRRMRKTINGYAIGHFPPRRRSPVARNTPNVPLLAYEPHTHNLNTEQSNDPPSVQSSGSQHSDIHTSPVIYASGRTNGQAIDIARTELRSPSSSRWRAVNCPERPLIPTDTRLDPPISSEPSQSPKPAKYAVAEPSPSPNNSPWNTPLIRVWDSIPLSPQPTYPHLEFGFPLMDWLYPSSLNQHRSASAAMLVHIPDAWQCYQSTRPPISFIPDGPISLQEASQPHGMLWASSFDCHWRKCRHTVTRKDFITYEGYFGSVNDHLGEHAKGMPQGAVHSGCGWKGCNLKTRSPEGLKHMRDKMRHIVTHLPWYTLCTKCTKIWARRDARGTKNPCTSGDCWPNADLAMRVRKANEEACRSGIDITVSRYYEIVFEGAT